MRSIRFAQTHFSSLFRARAPRVVQRALALGAIAIAAACSSGDEPIGVATAAYVYYPNAEACNVCPVIGTDDGTGCLVLTAPTGTVPIAVGQSLYVTPLPGGVCPMGTLAPNGQYCLITTLPAGEDGYVYGQKIYVAPHCCPCPSRGHFDGEKCLVAEPPAKGQPFILDNQFYYSAAISGQCPIGTWDGQHCILGHNGAADGPILEGGKFYLDSVCKAERPNASYANVSAPSAPTPVGELCAPGFTYDGAHCKLATAPPNTTAFISSDRFYHTKVPGLPTPPLWQSGGACPAPSMYDGANCERGKIPAYYTPFIYQNGWYTDVNPRFFVSGGTWWTQQWGDAGTLPHMKRPECLSGDQDRSWHLLWEDEFEPKGNGQTCYTSNDRVACTYEVDWNHQICTDSPTNWTTAGRAAWSTAQHQRYDGLVDLDKCHWEVMDAYNVWDNHTNGTPARASAFTPTNVHVEDGVLKLETGARPNLSAYDCGINYPDASGAPHHTKICPYTAANVTTSTVFPFNLSNSPTHTDPTKRYVGRDMGPGRIDIRARIMGMGHGAWPALWLFTDHKAPGSTETHNGEMDALEMVHDNVNNYGPGQDPISRGTATYGMAWQTGHDWVSSNQSHSDSVGIPISTGEYHVYSVEWDMNEVRFYIDGCLRNVLTEGEQIKNAWDPSQVHAFHIPRDTTYYLMLGVTPAGSDVLKPWARATVMSGGGPRADFQPTELHVDYVRYYAKVSD